MDGENNGKPYEQMDDLGGFSPIFLVQHPKMNLFLCSCLGVQFSQLKHQKLSQAKPLLFLEGVWIEWSPQISESDWRMRGPIKIDEDNLLEDPYQFTKMWLET